MGVNKRNKTDCDSATGDMNVNPAHFDTIMAELDEEAFSLFLFLCSNFSKEKLIESGDGYRLNINNRDFMDSLVDKPEYGDFQLGKSFDAYRECTLNFQFGIRVMKLERPLYD